MPDPVTAPPSTGGVTAAVFDFAGVLTSSPYNGLVELAASLDRDPVEFRHLVTGRDEGDADHPFQQMLRGEVSLAYYFLALMDRLTAEGIDVDISELIRSFTDLRVNEGIPERIIALRQRGLRTALVTNTAREAAGLWRSLVDLDACFDTVVMSWEVGMRKPDHGIWRVALERIGNPDPRRVALLESTPAFCDAGQAIGMRAIPVTDPDHALDCLEQLVAD